MAPTLPDPDVSVLDGLMATTERFLTMFHVETALVRRTGGSRRSAARSPPPAPTGTPCRADESLMGIAGDTHLTGYEGGWRSDGEVTEINKRVGDDLCWIIWTLSIVIPIVVFEIGECSARISQWMINASAGILGMATTPEIGRIYKKEWSAALLRLPGKLTKLLLTTSMLLRAVPRLWWILVGQGIPANLGRTLRQRAGVWQRARNSPKPGVELARIDRRHVGMRSRSSCARIIIFDNEEFDEFLARAKKGAYDLDALAS
jgi:hypothetical protein